MFFFKFFLAIFWYFWNTELITLNMIKYLNNFHCTLGRDWNSYRVWSPVSINLSKLILPHVHLWPLFPDTWSLLTSMLLAATVPFHVLFPCLAMFSCPLPTLPIDPSAVSSVVASSRKAFLTRPVRLIFLYYIFP